MRLQGNDDFAGRKAGAVDAQPTLKFYDGTMARPSSEFVTGGCNMPRMSEETLGSEGRFSGDLV